MNATVIHALKHGAPKMKNLKSFHAHETNEGHYHVEMHHGGKSHKQAVSNMSDVMGMLEDHMGQPNQGEAELEGANGGA